MNTGIAFPKVVELEEDVEVDRGPPRWVSFQGMIGSSSAMKAVYSTVAKVAGTNVPVVILGESGTGKELVASAIHRLGSRRNGPFTVINCGAIPETLLESELFGSEKGSFTGATIARHGRLECARGGTLFLDEIGDLAPEPQVKILRFLQEKIIERVGGREPIAVDCRVIAATHRCLEKAVQESRFREDLYFRLAVVKIVLPPLKDRGNDIIELAEYLLNVYSKELNKPARQFSKAGIEAMRNYSWTGNVRELQNRIKRALVLEDGPAVEPADLEIGTASRRTPSSGSTLRQAREELEQRIIFQKLQETRGNISRTAKALGITRPTLYALMGRYRLKAAPVNSNWR